MKNRRGPDDNNKKEQIFIDVVKFSMVFVWIQITMADTEIELNMSSDMGNEWLLLSDFSLISDRSMSIFSETASLQWYNIKNEYLNSKNK